MRHRLFVLLLLVSLALPTVACADMPAPLPHFSQITEDQQFRFVMLARADDRSAYHEANFIEETPALRQRYPASDLYRMMDQPPTLDGGLECL